jgi:phosphocarrier protein HPr
MSGAGSYQGRSPAPHFCGGSEMELIHSKEWNPLLPIEGKNMSVIEKITIFHRLGLHLRTAAELARVALRFKSEIHVSNGYQKANAKSLLDLLTLGAIYGTVLEFSADGEDAPQAIQAIRELIHTWKANNDEANTD